VTAMKTQEKAYVEIIDRDGRPMQTIYPGCERYPRDVELNMLERGYTIRVNERKLTKKELREDGKD
jgi:hypothetical protein